MKKLAIETVVACDDIRREANTGKYFLVGAYNYHMRVPAFPFDVALSWWIQIRAFVDGMQSMEFRIIGPHDAILLSAEFQVQLRTGEHIRGLMQLNHTPIQIQVEGPIKLQ